MSENFSVRWPADDPSQLANRPDRQVNYSIDCWLATRSRANVRALKSQDRTLTDWIREMSNVYRWAAETEIGWENIAVSVEWDIKP